MFLKRFDVDTETDYCDYYYFMWENESEPKITLTMAKLKHSSFLVRSSYSLSQIQTVNHLKMSQVILNQTTTPEQCQESSFSAGDSSWSLQVHTVLILLSPAGAMFLKILHH